MSETIQQDTNILIPKGNVKYREQNQISRPANVLLHAVFLCAAAFTIVPLWVIVAASLTQEQALILNGYRFWPSEFSTLA